MPLFGKKGSKSVEYKAQLEHKLYLARENPEPVFDLSNCGLKTVPAGIYSLCKVFRKEMLLLQENQLISLTGGGNMQDLVLLQVLDLHCNKLSALPEDIRYLKNLRELNIKANQLTHLPEAITRLENLEILNASENNLKCLPDSIGNLNNLQLLDVRLNKDLKRLPSSLCKAYALRELLLTPENFMYPGQDVLLQGTKTTLRFLASECGLDFESLANTRQASAGSSSHVSQQPLMEKQQDILEAKILQLERLKVQKQRERLALEKVIEEQQQKELSLQVAMKRTKEQLLQDLVLQQARLESEISRIQQDKEAERQLLLQELQQEENATDAVVSQLLAINSNDRNSVYLQQLLDRERDEEEKILNVHQEEYRSLRRKDVLNAMESLLEEECLREKMLRQYEEGRWKSTRTLLDQEAESGKQLEEWLANYGLVNSALVGRLQEDEQLQRAAVASLLERSDARSWGLVQQVKLVESQLAALTALEVKRHSLKVTEQMEDLCVKRIALSELLMNLLAQQDVRRQQLLSTLKEMEKRRLLEQEQQEGQDFWLLQYQRLLDSRSGSLMELEQLMDPALAHQLILNGVIHCLPFLTEWITSGKLSELSDDKLAKVGVRTPEIRHAILKAVKNYQKDICQRSLRSPEHTKGGPSVSGTEPSAPSELDVDVLSNIGQSECVVCMEHKCEIIFVPCGHLCCCKSCSELLTDCPMCRSHVDQKVRVILP